MADTDLYYNTGTIGVTNGSAAFTGSGTLWEGDPDHPTIMEGDSCTVISAGGDLTTYTIAAISADGAGTFTRNYAGTTGSGRTYIIHKNSPFRQETPRLLDWVRDLINDITDLTTVVTYENVASAVNFWKLTSAAAAGTLLLSAVGSDSNISTRIASKGTGSQYFQVDGVDVATLSATGLLMSQDGAGGGGTATPHGITLHDVDTGNSWDIVNAFVKIDFSSADTTTLGAGVRFRIGARMTSAGGGASALSFWGAPATAGTLSEYFTMLNTTGAATFANTLTASAIIPSGSSAPTNGLYLPASNTLGWAVNSALEVQLTASAFSPGSNDGNALGTTALGWADLHLASGGVINWVNGEVTLTETSANLLTLAGGALSITDSTASTSTTTGSLIIAGGLGVGGAAFFGAAATATAFIPSSSTVPTNGLYLPSNNTLGFATNSGLAVIIDGGNRILKGNTSNIQVGGVSPAIQVNGTSTSGAAFSNTMWSTTAGVGGYNYFARTRQTTIGGAASAIALGNAVGGLRWAADDGTDLSTIGAEIKCTCAATPSTGIVAMDMVFSTMPAAGTLAARLTLYSTGGLTNGSPTGGDKGTGTINATAVYDDNTLLTCFGIEYLKYGRVDLKAWDAFAPGGEHALARAFVSMIDADFDPRAPQFHRAYVERMLREEALPGMPSKRDWQHNALSVGQMTDRLWLAAELQAGAIKSLADDIDDHDERIEALTAELSAAKARIAKLEPIRLR